MLKNRSQLLSYFTGLCCVLSSAMGIAQPSMLAEFKAMPAFPAGAKEAFAACQKIVADERYMYEKSSLPVSTYTQKLQNDAKPYQEIITAKGKQGMAPGMGAASDFSDLSSPETQAKIAKMTQEEQIKFAMEIQQRMQTNKNLQTVNTLSKPSPLTQLILKLNTSCNNLQAVLPEYPKAAVLSHAKCDFNCGDFDKPCADRMAVCNHKVSQDYHIAEIARYNTFIKNIPVQFNLKKTAFENDLKEFDTQAAKYPKEVVAADYINVISMVMRIGAMVDYYEKEGATTMIEAKNDPYCAKDF